MTGPTGSGSSAKPRPGLGCEVSSATLPSHRGCSSATFAPRIGSAPPALAGAQRLDRLGQHDTPRPPRPARPLDRSARLGQLGHGPAARCRGEHAPLRLTAKGPALGLLGQLGRSTARPGSARWPVPRRPARPARPARPGSALLGLRHLACSARLGPARSAALGLLGQARPCSVCGTWPARPGSALLGPLALTRLRSARPARARSAPVGPTTSATR